MKNVKLGFLVTVWLVHVQVFCSSSSDNAETDMKRAFDKISENMLQSLTSSIHPPSDRHKRDLSSKTQSLIDDTGVYRLASIKPVSTLCHPAIRTLFIDVSNITYAVCISASTTEKPAEVIVGQYREHEWIPTYQWYVQNPAGVAAFHFKKNLYVLVAESERGSGPDLVRINLSKGVATIDHTVYSTYATSIAIWQMKHNGDYNLAIANSAGYKDAADLSTEVFVYKWKGTFFDRYASFLAYDVKDIEPFHVHGAAYIAIANFRRGKNSPDVDSEIFRYDWDGNAWSSHQKIRTYGAMDWEFFALGSSLGQEFFLAAANKGNGKEVKSMIYKFVEDKFLPFQCLPTTRATSIASFSRDSMFLLAVANEDDAVHLYQYDGWHFVRSGVQSTTGALSYGVTDLQFHSVMHNSENTVILSVSNPLHPLYQSLFEIGFWYENALQEWHDKSTDWCLKILSEVENTDIDKSIGNFDDVIFTDQESIQINGNLVFENGFAAETLTTPKLSVVSIQETFDENLLIKLSNLQKRLESIKAKLEEFSLVLSRSLKIDGDQNITSKLKFEDALLNCGSNKCHFVNIYTDVLNGERITDWADHLIFLDSDQVINGTLIAEEIKATDVNVFGLIDGVESKNLVTKSGNHNITGYKTFTDFIAANDIEVSGKVDGVEISSSSVLLTTGHQHVTGNLHFDDVQTAWLESEYVNGRDFSKFYNDLVLTNGPFVITGEKTFSDVTVDALMMNYGSTINGVDLVDLWENTLWIDENQEIKAEITFSDVMIKKNLKVLNGINGIQIPGPRIVDVTESANIIAPHVFQNSTKISHLTVLQSLNGIPLVSAPDGSKQLDIMLKTGDQIVTGIKKFHTIHLDADSYVYGTVDGVDLSEFKNSVLRKDTSVVTNGTWVFNNLVIKGPLAVDGKISGIDLKDVYERALKLGDSEVQEMIFEEYVDVEDLQSNNINGIDIKNDLVLVNETQTITGKKTFNEIVLEEDSTVFGLVNNMNLSFLNEILLKIGSQKIKSKTFMKNVKIKDLTVIGSINGVSVDDIVTLKGGQIFGSRMLKNVNFTTIEAKNVEITGKVNDINLGEMIEDTMTYDGNQTVTGTKEFKGTINIMDASNLQTTDLNGINVGDLWADAVFIDVPQIITGKKTFNDNVVFDHLSFDSTFDGVSYWDMKYNWMLKNAPQTVKGDVVFKDGFSAKDLNVGLLNDLDIKQLESEIVKVNEKTEIEGPIIFMKSVLSNGNISLTGKIQGVDLSEEAVQRDKVIVTGKKTFLEDLVIEGDLTVDGTVDGVDVSDLCRKAIHSNKKQNISRLIIKGDVTFTEGGTIGGTLAGVDLKLLEDVAVINDGSPIRFSGLKTFSNVTFEGPVIMNGKVGGVYLKVLADNYMSLTKDQNIFARMEFDDLAFQGVLSAENLNIHNQVINGINLQELDGRILKSTGNQVVSATYYIHEAIFKDDVFVAGKVNGIEIPSGLMRRNHTNYIQSPKIFEKTVLVLGDLEMEEGKTIQGVDVSDWYKKAVLIDGKFEIYGYKTFNQLELNDVRVEGLFDGMKISEEHLLMTYGNQLITGRKLIVGKVDVEGSLTVNGFINNVNLTDLSIETLQRDRSNMIMGLKNFVQPLTIVSLQAPTVAGVDVVKLQEKLNASFDLNLLENRLEEIEGLVSHMQVAFDNQAVIFQYYELYDEFDIPTAYNWLYVSGTDCGELLLLFDNSSSNALCSSIRIFGYDRTVGSFVPARQQIKTSYAVSVKSLTFQNSTFLFVANQNPNAPCSKVDIGQTTIDIYAWNVDSFVKHQSLSSHGPSDMVVFDDELLSCIVFLEHGSTPVYCATANAQNFTQHEVLLSKGGRKAAILKYLGKIILAIVSEDLSTPRRDYVEGRKYIDIYEWNSENAKFSTPKQVIESTFAQSVLLMKHVDKYHEMMFLAVAEGSLPKIYNEPKIIIYRYEDSFSKPFQKYQEIKNYGTLECITLNTGELLLFVDDSLGGKIELYQYKEASGFVNIDTVKSLGTIAVHPFVRSDPDDWLNHYLALAGPRASMAQPTQGVNYAKILKSKVKGKRPIY